MIRSFRRGRRTSLLPVVGLSIVIAIAATAFAAEPDGHIRLRAEWIETEDGGAPVVRLSIRSLVPLDGATLTVGGPLDFTVLPLGSSGLDDFAVVPTTGDRRAIRADLPRLEAFAPRIVDFEWSTPPERYGILEFIVEGRDAKGRKIRNAIGLAAGEARIKGVRRGGAIEFPATVLPRAEER